jgi:transposase InsO family protein
MWHADYTELPTDQGPLSLVAVVDGCSRLAVGHALGEHATAELAIGAVELGVWRRGVVDDALIHHSDPGSSPAWRSGSGCGRWGSARRWGRWATATTTR